MNDLPQRIVFILLALSFSSHGQTQQPAVSTASDRITFNGSLNENATAEPQFAPSAFATLVRSELTQAERDATIEFSVALRMRDFADLQERVGNREIISLDEMAAKYYPTAADCKAIVDSLTAQGFTVQPPDKYNLSLFASGSVAQIERAFATKFGRVKFAGVEYSSALIPPSLSATIAGPVLGINGLQPHLHPRSHANVAPGQPQKLINNQPPYTVKEIADAYNAGGLSVNGSGQTIAIVIDTFPASSDLTAFWQGNGIAQSLSNIEKVQVVSGTLPLPSGEETLDVEWSSGMASGAKVRVYATTDLGFAHLDKAYQAIINDLPSQPTLHQLSLSYGLGETYESTSQMQTDAQYFASLAGSGVTVFVSAGDGGSTPGTTGYGDNTGPVQVECPANDPNVTSVGGTSLLLNSSTGAVSSEVAWSLGGGGISKHFARPSWQTGSGVPTGTFRTVPDVALVADLNTGGYLIFTGHLYTVGGTSWGAPTWAGFCAIINQARANIGQSEIGLLGPKIYPLNGTSSFRDITTGSNGPNGIYNAGSHYDLCTGLGVPSVASLVQATTAGAQVFPAADLNGDGRSDLVLFNQALNQVDVWLMNGNTVVANAFVGNGPANYHIVAVADLQHTGRAQIIWSNGTTNYLAWSIAWSVSNTPTLTATSFSLPANYPVLVCADFDSDGLVDVVQFNPANHALLIAKNNGSLSFTTRYSRTVGSTETLIGAADLNGTGHPQLIWQNVSSRQVVAWAFSAANPFLPAQFPAFPSRPLVWVIQGIGKVDTTPAKGLIWHNSQTGAVSFWKMNTNGSVAGNALQLSLAAPSQIASDAYFDGSGTVPEILWVNRESGGITVWRVTGSAVQSAPIGTPGTSWIVEPTATGSSSTP
jgi:kumamolisin